MLATNRGCTTVMKLNRVLQRILQQNTTKAMKTVLSNCELIEDTQYLNKQPQGDWDGINNC